MTLKKLIFCVFFSLRRVRPRFYFENSRFSTMFFQRQLTQKSTGFFHSKIVFAIISSVFFWLDIATSKVFIQTPKGMFVISCYLLQNTFKNPPPLDSEADFDIFFYPSPTCLQTNIYLCLEEVYNDYSHDMFTVISSHSSIKEQIYQCLGSTPMPPFESSDLRSRPAVHRTENRLTDDQTRTGSENVVVRAVLHLV